MHDPVNLQREPIEGWPAYVLARAPALVAYVDASLRYRYANERYLEWMGVDWSFALGSHLADVLSPTLYAGIEPNLRAALSGRTVVSDHEIGEGDNTRYAQATFNPDVAEDGAIRGVIIAVIDISERRELENRLLESQRRFSQAFRYAAIGMALVYPDGRWLQVNDAICSMLGYSEDDLLSSTFQDITHPDDLAADLALVDRLLDGELMSYHMEKRYLHRDGHVVHALLSVSLVRDETNQPLYFVSQLQDITERKAFEDALFRERELAEVTLKSIGDAVITTDPNMIVTSLNPIAEAMTGWSSHEAVGRPMDEVFHLRDPLTRQPIPNPLISAVTKNAIVGLTTDAILVHRNGFDSPIEDSAAPIHDHAGNVVGGVVVFHDVSETRALALKMAHLAHHDTLTGLPNRALLQSRIELAVTVAMRRTQRTAVLFVDIDHFKQINDTLGHAAGDAMLQEVARRIRMSVRSDDTVSRLGGDEFVVLLPHIESQRDAASVAEKVLEVCSQAVAVEGSELAISFSIGISVFPDDARDADALMRNADTAMYEAKMQGRNGFRFFNAAMNERNAARVRIEVELRKALARNELSLHYQPKVDTRLGIIIGAEALLRWQVDGEDVYTPEQFIPVAEDCGLIIPIGEWALREACRQTQEWHTMYRPLSVSVNVSPLQFQQTRFFETLRDALAESQLHPTLLELELTERMVMEGGDHIASLLRRIKELGVVLSLDDFGTGYCSLSYLKHFPIDTLKIDRAFVRDIAWDADSAAITSAIIAMAHSLNKNVLAEGVETMEQATFLGAAGCPQMQGFLFGKAVSAKEFEARIAAINTGDLTV
ncbi:PAS domain S-box-containing protein/diguanylate cyclase (GGDEF)-like protein [Luteibacter rhizovicinus]|uniref:PAS domain S-box-containing protein/diguanylate cyclase (GGDEF)-like protein n=1 Tax=Luteibacter rhizovicinus TaxID=242606 RepID=A0A4R3YV74_9GAMM|nr:GGDEF and EAL domain-containing protein [Luteibacter rhizovicinus]TCV96336.1 PAS domain S-box-containing protein/diguanylate cyclase (GGDEF)-like protein [Luteibacter rhizovicinus]